MTTTLPQLADLPPLVAHGPDLPALPAVGVRAFLDSLNGEIAMRRRLRDETMAEGKTREAYWHENAMNATRRTRDSFIHHVGLWWDWAD